MNVNALTEAEWTTLCGLADKTGFPNERVMLLRRADSDTETATRSRTIFPLSLVLAQPGAGLELFLDRWISREAAGALEKAGDRPLAMGPDPEAVCAKLPAWGRFRWKNPANGHLILCRQQHALGSELTTGLATLGFADHALFVTRLSQPFNQSERNLAKAAASLAATARVLVIGLPEEDPGANELAKLESYLVGQLRQTGFGSGRALGAGVWFLDGDRKRPGALADPVRFLEVGQPEVASGRGPMIRQAATAILAEIRAKCPETPVSRHKPVPAEEVERLSSELAGHLEALGRKLTHRAASGAGDVNQLRAFALEELRSWGTYLGVEGTWMKYVERLHPGTQAGLLTEANAALDALSYDPPPEARQERRGQTGGGLVDSSLIGKAVLEAKRVLVGIACGIVAYWAGTKFLPGNQLGVMVLRNAAILAVAVIGYSIGRRLLRGASDSVSSRPLAEIPVSPTGVDGWDQIARRIVLWFHTRLQSTELSVDEQCEALEAALREKVTD